MAADLSVLSNEDLLALKAGDLSKVSTAGLIALKGGGGPSAAARVANDPITKGAQAVVGATPAELIAGSAPGRFLLQPARGLLELGSHLGLPGGQSAEELKGMIERGREAYDNKGLDIAGLAGQIASPAVLKAGNIVKLAGLPGKIASGVATGATAGAVTPTEGKGDFWTEKGLQTGTGAALGGVIPLGGSLIRGLLGTGYRAFEPILPGGPEAIWNRFKDQLVSPAKDKIVQALAQARELVPGSKPTVGEALAAIPEASPTAAFQRIVAKSQPAAPGFVAREQAQEGARSAALGGVAQTPEALATAESARASEAAKNYAAAFEETAKKDKDLSALYKDPYFKKALSDARDLAKSKGITAKEDLTQFLHYVKVGLDKQLSRTGDTALAATEKEAVQGVKDKLMAWMDEKNPAYGYARRRFADLSGPINQMQVGQGLADKLAAPLGASERAAAYASALRDPAALIKETGARRSLEEILTPEQLAAVQDVGADLGRKAQFERLARGTNMSGAGIQPENILPNLLSRPAMLVNYLAKKVAGHNLENKINAIAGPEYLDPAKFAASLKDVPPSKLKKITDAILAQTAQPIVVGGPAAAVAQHY